MIELPALAVRQLGWAVRRFGSVALNRRERALRFVEEAIELAQAEGVDMETLLKVSVRVYDAPPGRTGQEAGQCQMTLSLLCANARLNLEQEYLAEWERIQQIPDAEWHRRHQAKVDLGIATKSPPVVEP